MSTKWKAFIKDLKAWWKSVNVTPDPVKPDDPVIVPDDPVTPPADSFPQFTKGRIVRLEKKTHNFSALFYTPVGLRACAYENRHEDGRDDAYLLDPFGKRIHSEKCETFGEPVGAGGVLRIPQEGGDARVNAYDVATGRVTQSSKQPHKIALCGVMLRGTPHIFSWNQKQGGDSRTAMHNDVTGAVIYTFPGVIGCPVSAVELTPGVALCAMAFDNSGRDDGACVTTDGRRVGGSLKVSELVRWRGKIYGGGRGGGIYPLDEARMSWGLAVSALGAGCIFKLRPGGDRYLYATVDGPPRLCVILPDGRWTELDRGPQQSYGQFGINCAVSNDRAWWTRQDESKTGCVVELVLATGEDD